ncbi:divergent polysaccharide deacetylase family protein, partial [Pseudoalteromonas sp. S327]|uniref:divergent polysaccharide deacetylase family protein n=1 Tax=Pseudoalteromonas sp. S327 TaxID=579535 RepID=UPI0024B509EC
MDRRKTDLSHSEYVEFFIGVETIGRDVFFDNINTHEQLQQRLDELIYKATKHHIAIANAHTYAETSAFLRQALHELTQQGFELVPISQLVERKFVQKAQQQANTLNCWSTLAPDTNTELY